MIVIDIIYGGQKSVIYNPLQWTGSTFYIYKKWNSSLSRNTNSFYTIPQLKRTNNGDGYYCHAKGDTVCYHLNITCMYVRT